jgi:hypothetical protein
VRLLSSDTGIYAYFDADDVGARIELSLLEGDVEGASLVSQRVSAAILWLGECLAREFGGQVKFAAGDEVLALLGRVPSRYEIDAVREEFQSRCGLSISCGLGEGSNDAVSQLRLAKLRGKNRLEGELVV